MGSSSQESRRSGRRRGGAVTKENGMSSMGRQKYHVQRKAEMEEIECQDGACDVGEINEGEGKKRENSGL